MGCCTYGQRIAYTFGCVKFEYSEILEPRVKITPQKTGKTSGKTIDLPDKLTSSALLKNTNPTVQKC